MSQPLTPDAQDSNFDCQWSKADYFHTSEAKEAVNIIIFLLFFAYTALTAMRWTSKDSKQTKKMFDLINETAFSHIFFFISAILVHSLAPTK